jgi:hypothetical protein
MSVRKGHLHEPESCICPNCGKVMRVFLVPALKALDTNEFYLRCNSCEYVSVQVTEICIEQVRDNNQESDWTLTASNLFDQCEREIAGLLRASGSRA